MSEARDLPQVSAGEPLDGGAMPFFEELDEGGHADGEDTSGLGAVQDVQVVVQVVLGRARMTVAELLQLRIGSVVELDRRVGEPVDIFVNNRLIARGEVVMIDDALGVTLTEIVHAEG